jgi:NB-ARC domain
MSNKAHSAGHALGCVASTVDLASVDAAVDPATPDLPLLPLAHPGRATIPLFPAPMTNFLGRDRELQAIERLIAQGVNVIEIADPLNKIGMGKTALAIAAVHRLQRHYGDCQLYANLYGQDAFPAHARDVLQEWLVLKFGLHPRALPQRVSELQMLYQQQLEGKKAIIVLDNVVNLKQIQPLLALIAGQNPTNYVILITSRTSILTADYGKTLFVDRLGAEAALNLLTGTTAHSEDADSPSHKSLQQLIKLADGSPFVLQVLGSLLAQDLPPAPEMLMLEIEKSKRKYQQSYAEPLSQLMGCLNVAYQSLAIAERDLLSRLSVLHGAQFNASLAAHLCGEPIAAVVESRLARLHDRGWLTPMPNLVHVGQSQEYTMPEVARSFLWKKVLPKARRTLVSWALSWNDQDRNAIDQQMLELRSPPILPIAS